MIQKWVNMAMHSMHLNAISKDSETHGAGIALWAGSSVPELGSTSPQIYHTHVHIWYKSYII